jgi:hypothetical protein
LLIFYNAFADPDWFLTRLNSVVLTKMGETLEMVIGADILGKGFSGWRVGD